MFDEPALEDIPTIRSLVSSMDAVVAGLEDVKLRLAWTLHRHMVAAVLHRAWRPANLLVMGDSGVGKTHTLRALLAACPVIHAEVVATEYSDVGFAGRNLTSMYSGLAHRRWHGDENLSDLGGGETAPSPDRVGLIERFGVVVIDEFDKLRASMSALPDRQNSKMIAMQAELLKLSEGAEIVVKSTDDDEGWSLSTHGILHIACGAFQGLDTLLWSSLSHQGGEAPPDLKGKAGISDMVAFGFMEELVGRFATFIPLPSLKPDQVIRILTEQVIPKWQRELKDLGLTLEVEPGALSHIATYCLQTKIGARALEPMMDAIIWKSGTEAPRGSHLLVDADAADRQRAKILEPARA